MCAKILKKFAGIAQSVEQLIRNQQVAGSSPVTSSRRVEVTSSALFIFVLVVEICKNMVYNIAEYRLLLEALGCCLEKSGCCLASVGAEDASTWNMNWI